MSNDLEFINTISTRLPKFKKQGNNFVCRCIVCGDSQKSKSKTRFYILPINDTYYVKCHNCGYSTSFGNFLKEFFHDEYGKYALSKFSKSDVKEEQKIIKPTHKINKLLSVCNNIRHNTIEGLYLTNRGLDISKFLCIKDFSIFSKIVKKYKDSKLPNDSRIIIPFYTRNGILFAIQGRAIDKNSIRYITLKFNESLPLIYNWNKIDFSKTIYVTEGAFDASLLDNACAVAGSDFSKIFSHFSKNDVVIVLDNEKRNKEILKKYEMVIEKGYRIVIWPDNIKEKDINEMMLNDIDFSSVLVENTYSGLKAKVEFNKWKKIT